MNRFICFYKVIEFKHSITRHFFQHGTQLLKSYFHKCNFVLYKNHFTLYTTLWKDVDSVRVTLWEKRTEKRFTLVQLAEKTGLGKSTLNNIENGKVSPTLIQLEKIAIALEVRITELFESEYK